MTQYTLAVPPLSPELTVRFWSKVDKNGPMPAHCPELGPCWLWTAGTFPFGYGAFSIGRRPHTAHRISWTLMRGPIAPGMSVLHRCDVPACLNPSHLFVGTQADNIRDAAAKGRLAKGDRNGAYTHPERRPSGERHGSRTHPERLPRDDTHYSRQQPERLARGERHGAHVHPETVRRGETVNTARLGPDQVREIRRLAANGMPRYQLALMYAVSKGNIAAIVRRDTWKHIE